MNYRRIYDQLIEHAQGSPRPQETSEEHHIVPRCMGGGEEASNKVYLSAHEHIWAHIWLAQIYPDVFGLQLTVSMVVFGDNKNLGRFPTEEQVRESTEARERSKNTLSERMSGEKNPMFGKPGPMRGKITPEETRKKISKANSGKVFTDQHRENMSKNSHMSGKSPWLHHNTLKSPKSLQVWYSADDYFKLWKEHQCADAKLARLFGVSWGRAHRSIILKFRAGWDPNSDPEWLSWKALQNFTKPET